MGSRHGSGAFDPAPAIPARAWSVLFASTLAFLVCFVVWMMFGVLGVPLREDLHLNSTEFGLLTSTPVLTGALMRLPLGAWTDRFGGRIVMTVLLVVCSVPVYGVSYANALWQFLLIGLFLGCVGASFAVGTPYVARFFPPRRRGLAMGVFGAGTVGAAVNLFVTPLLLAAYGWRVVPRVYALALVVTAAVFWFASAPDPGAGEQKGSWVDSFKVLRDPRVWKLCQYYSITFGGFTALSLWIPQYLKNGYGMSLVAASAFAAGFSLPGSVLRALGGALADRYGAHAVTWWGLWVAWICLFLLSYPPTDLVIHTIDGTATLRLHVPLAAFVVLTFVLGAVFAFGMASTFKYVADDFPNNMGVVTGIVGLAGGLGGFLLPIIFGALVDLLRVRSTCFMFLYGIVWVSLILLYLADKLGRFIPADLRGRNEALQWLFWQMGGLGPMAGQNHHFVQYAPEPLPYAIERYVKETSRLYGVLNKHLSDGRDYIAGEYSIADMASYPWIVPHERQRQRLEDFPFLAAWFARVAERPGTVRAYARAKEINTAPTVDQQSRGVLFGQDASTVR